ncbi:hypothetical protein DFJ73DRAFT_467409 [Zopfochytrium polystomum]|nr:hypothetical protein DFJ73DRAFT_467409 [Zopfochytrium polystomum]
MQSRQAALLWLVRRAISRRPPHRLPDESRQDPPAGRPASKFIRPAHFTLLAGVSPPQRTTAQRGLVDTTTQSPLLSHVPNYRRDRADRGFPLAVSRVRRRRGRGRAGADGLPLRLRVFAVCCRQRVGSGRRSLGRDQCGRARKTVEDSR